KISVFWLRFANDATKRTENLIKQPKVIRLCHQSDGEFRASPLSGGRAHPRAPLHRSIAKGVFVVPRRRDGEAAPLRSPGGAALYHFLLPIGGLVNVG